MDLQIKSFSDIDVNDPFFDSLRDSYPEFNDWYSKKYTIRVYIKMKTYRLCVTKLMA